MSVNVTVFFPSEAYITEACEFIQNRRGATWTSLAQTPDADASPIRKLDGSLLLSLDGTRVLHYDTRLILKGHIS